MVFTTDSEDAERSRRGRIDSSWRRLLHRAAGRALPIALVLLAAACQRSTPNPNDVVTAADVLDAADALDAVAADAEVDSGFLDAALTDRAPLPPPLCPARDASAPRDVVAGPLTVVRVDGSSTAPQQLAVHACAGLRNRARPGSVFINANANDAAWISELALAPASTVTAAEFLSTCAAELPSCVRYDYEAQRPLLPNILTAAAVLGALPVDRSMTLSCATTSFDATIELRDRNTPALATRYVFDRFAAQTTGLAMLNPGYELAPMQPATPRITRDMGPALVDLVFSERLFLIFLVNGCIDGHPEKELLSSMVNSGRWPSPVAVYGYNNSWFTAGGYLYEAQTLCLASRNMGAIASETANLSYFSTRSAPIEGPGILRQNDPEPITYDPTRTYVAFVVGDGDNIDFIMSTRREWIQQRAAACRAGAATCPPLTWTISSHLTRLAPDVLRWYYDQGRRTGRDYFALPPSGHLYAYPSSLAPAARDRFVAATEEDACSLGLTGVVHWDWAGTWEDAERVFLPRYARLGGPVRGIFPVNVPYVLPIFTWWPPSRFFQIVTGADGGQVALFKPRSWRGVNSDTDRFFLRPQRMAEEIAAYPRGTVTWVYMTSDGGLNLQNSYLALLAMLPPHVQLVSTDTAARLAIESRR